MTKTIKVNLKGANVNCIGKYNCETTEKRFLQTLNITRNAFYRLKSIVLNRKTAIFLLRMLFLIRHLQQLNLVWDMRLMALFTGKLMIILN